MVRNTKARKARKSGKTLRASLNRMITRGRNAFTARDVFEATSLKVTMTAVRRILRVLVRQGKIQILAVAKRNQITYRPCV